MCSKLISEERGAKSSIRVSVVISLIFFVSALMNCSMENIPPKNNIEVIFGKGQSKNLQCLSHIYERINSFFAGELKAEDVDDFFNCTVYAINLFSYFAEGRVKNTYQAEEISEFLRVYFLKGEKPSTVLRNEMMHLKSALIGGSSKELTLKELYKFRFFMDVILRKSSLSLVSEMKVLKSGVYGERDTSLNVIDVERASQKLQKVFVDFGEFFGLSGNSYSFEHFSALMNELTKLSDQKENSIFKNAEFFVNIMQETKVLLIGGSRVLIGGREWKELFHSLSDIYQVWLRVQNFVAPEDLTVGRAKEQFEVVAKDTFRILKSGINRQENKVYSHKNAQNFIYTLKKISNLPFDLDVSLVTSLWEVFVDKIFAPEGSIVKGLTVKKINFASSQFDIWSKIQDRINETVNNNFDASDEKLLQLRGVLQQSPWPLSFDPLGRINVGDGAKKYDSVSLKYLNFERSIVYLIVRAYSKNRSSSGDFNALTISEVQSFIEDIKPLAVGMGLMAADDVSFHLRIFRDTNLFLPNSNGDAVVDLVEAVHYLHYVVSGMNTKNSFMDQLGSKCLLTEAGLLAKYNEDCFKEYFRSKQTDIFSHMPRMRHYLSKMQKTNPDGFENYLSNLVKIVKNDSSANFITSSDILEMLVLQQYIETLMARYDRDKDEFFNVEESLFFLERHITTVGKILNFNPIIYRNYIRAFFTYILKFEKSPTDLSDPLTTLRFDVWQETESNWNFAADRLRISYVLSILSGKK